MIKRFCPPLYLILKIPKQYIAVATDILCLQNNNPSLRQRILCGESVHFLKYFLTKGPNIGPQKDLAEQNLSFLGPMRRLGPK